MTHIKKAILAGGFSLESWVGAWVMLFGIGVLGFAPLYGLSALVLLITSSLIYFMDKPRLFARPFSRTEKLFLFFILFYFFSQTFAVFFQPAGYEYESLGRQLSAFDYVSRWVLLLPVWLLFRAYKIDWVYIAVGLAIGSIAGAVLGHFQIYYMGLSQAIGASNHPIPFGELMVIADVFLWIFMLRAWEIEKRWLSAVLFSASLAAFYGSLLAVTRGAWLVYPLLIAIYVVSVALKIKLNTKILFRPLIVFRGVTAVCLFALVAQTDHYQTMQAKTAATVSGLVTGNIDGATSLRYSNFVTAIESIKLYPFGIGMDNFGLANGARFGHAHNELLNTAVETGLVGVFALFTMILFNVYVFFSGSIRYPCRRPDINCSCGLMLLISFSIFSQSQAVFSHHDTLLFFIFYLYLFIGQKELEFQHCGRINAKS